MIHVLYLMRVGCAQNMFYNIIELICLQEILAEFHGTVPVNDNLGMKIYLATLMAFQLSELVCYSFLYYYVNNHNSEMLKSAIISNDIYLVNICLKPIRCGWLKLGNIYVGE